MYVYMYTYVKYDTVALMGRYVQQIKINKKVPYHFVIFTIITLYDSSKRDRKFKKNRKFLYLEHVPNTGFY